MNVSFMRIVLTGGGTGGHIFPLIAVARELRRRNSSVELFYFGPGGLGVQLFSQEGIATRRILAGKIPRYATPRIFLEFFKMSVGFFQALWEMYWFMPDLVFGKGGYGMVPVAFVARLFRIPVVLHESDAVAGLATRLVARFSREVLLSFPFTQGLKKEKGGGAHVVGNPVRVSLRSGDRARAQQRFRLALKPTVLVLGGSQGAEELNRLLIEIAPQLTREAEIIHQVGPRSAEDFAREMTLALEPYPDATRFYHIGAFFNEEELADAYAAATVVVSRAGAGAIFELALLGLPTVFLPLRNSAGNHQYRNAESLVRLGAASVLSGDNLTPHLLLSSVQDLLRHEEKRRLMSERFRAFARPHAAEEIAEYLLRYGEKP